MKSFLVGLIVGVLLIAGFNTFRTDYVNAVPYFYVGGQADGYYVYVNGDPVWGQSVVKIMVGPMTTSEATKLSDRLNAELVRGMGR